MHVVASMHGCNVYNESQNLNVKNEKRVKLQISARKLPRPLYE